MCIFIQQMKFLWLPFNIQVRMTERVITICQRYIPRYIHTKDEVSMTTYIDRKAHKRKVPKWLPFEKYKSE